MRGTSQTFYSVSLAQHLRINSLYVGPGVTPAAAAVGAAAPAVIPLAHGLVRTQAVGVGRRRGETGHPRLRIGGGLQGGLSVIFYSFMK